MDDIVRMHANICKTFANPKRLEIINALRNDEQPAALLLGKLQISKANLSQHMGVLVQKGVVVSRREGLNVFYRLSDSRITKACDLMREVMIKSMEENSKLLKKIKR